MFRRQKIGWYLAVGAGPFLLLSEVLLGGKTLYWGTAGLQFIPWRAYAWEIFQSGQIPLWNPLSGLGAPLVANYQSALFYPPGWLLVPFTAMGGVPWLAWGCTLLAALHLAWAGWGMMRLLDHLDLEPFAQAIGGMVFSLSGYLVARLSFFSMIWTAAWMPWVIFFVSRSIIAGKEIKTGRNYLCLSLTVCLAMMLLAGHAQLSWYGLLLAGGWALVMARLKGGGWKTQAESLGRVIVASLYAVALAAVQLFPTLEYLMQSQRSTVVDYETALTYSFWPWRFLTFIAPDLFGNPGRGNYWGYASYWEDAVYLGLLPALLAISTWGKIFRKKRDDSKNGRYKLLVIFLWTLTGIAFLLALGKNTPVFPLLFRYVPTFGLFHAPARFMIWAVFCLAILAAIGAQDWQPPRGRRLYVTRLATAAGAAVTMGAVITSFIMPDVAATITSAAAITGFLGVGSGLLCLFMPLKEQAKKWKIWAYVVLAWIGADLIIAGRLLNPLVEKEFFTTGSEQAEMIRYRLNGERMYISREDEYRLKFEHFFRFEDYRPPENFSDLGVSLLPNFNLLDGIASANNFDPLLIDRYAHWMDHLETLNFEQRRHWLSMMGVGIVERIKDDQLSGVTFLPLENAGRFRWASCVRYAQDQEEAWRLLNERIAAPGEIPPQSPLILEAEFETRHDCRAEGRARLLLLEETANSVTVQVETASAGWLVLADSWYPGWRAVVDGKPAAVMPADYLFRAVYVPDGTPVVKFIYRPASFYTGGAFSGVSLIFMLILGRREIHRSSRSSVTTK